MYEPKPLVSEKHRALANRHTGYGHPAYVIVWGTKSNGWGWTWVTWERCAHLDVVGSIPTQLFWGLLRQTATDPKYNSGNRLYIKWDALAKREGGGVQIPETACSNQPRVSINQYKHRGIGMIPSRSYEIADGVWCFAVPIRVHTVGFCRICRSGSQGKLRQSMNCTDYSIH